MPDPIVKREGWRVAAIGLGVFLAVLLAGCQVPRLGAQEDARGGHSGPLLSLAVDPTDGSLLRAGGGVFRSTDLGRSWQPLPIASHLQPDKIRQVVASAKAPGSLHAAGPGAGVLRSDDAGRTWRSIAGGLPSQDVIAVAVHSFLPNTVYAGIDGQGVFQTEDGGQRWQKMDEGPPRPVVALAHSPLAGSMNTGWLYAATADAPYLSMDCF